MLRRLWSDRVLRWLFVACGVALGTLVVVLVLASRWPVAEVMP